MEGVIYEISFSQDHRRVIVEESRMRSEVYP